MSRLLFESQLYTTEYAQERLAATADSVFKASLQRKLRLVKHSTAICSIYASGWIVKASCLRNGTQFCFQSELETIHNCGHMRAQEE